ncbi:MAG TPA: molybdopterin molybdotransferase MoeA [Planctomycetaceae bacterium]|nr:molybdopterin molybdotransferase MoeA [Planctomycetaceae bacterium]
MLSVDEAIAAIVRAVQPLPALAVELADALGHVLAEDIVSDADSPPFDKSLMDGFAIRSADLSPAGAALHVIEELTAGRVARRRVGEGEAIRIMTGAPIPSGADAVVPVEHSECDAATAIVRLGANVRPGANILRQGAALRRGERVLAAGRLLRPQELGALAELGRHRVSVRSRPRVGVLATGDELVPVSSTPGPGQIRNSNETMLVAQLRQAGAEPVPLGIARDRRDELRAKIAAGLECDMLLLSGGVSEGQLDLVPSELEAAGVRPVFHKVHLKPGKPVWFGVFVGRSSTPSESREDSTPSEAGGTSASGSDAGGRSGTPSYGVGKPVFGLPGNPVSSMVCFELFARTSLRRLTGAEPAAPQLLQARLAQEHLARGDRPTYHPASLACEGGTWIVRPVRWQGSADLRATVEANALALFPPGDRTWPAGTLVDVLPW